MKKNNWLWYFRYLVLIICYMVIGYNILTFMDNQRQMTYNSIPFMIVSTLVFTIMGFLLGVEKFLIEMKKEGPWKINLPRIILLGIPALYFSLSLFMYYCPIDFVRQILVYPVEFFLKSKINFIPMFQLILGYIVITSFIKVNIDCVDKSI